MNTATSITVCNKLDRSLNQIHFLPYLLSFLFLPFFPFISYSQPLSYTIESTSLQPLIGWDGGAAGFEINDINDDGFLDILSVGDHGSPFINTQEHGIMIFFGNGTGTGWTLSQVGDLGYGGIAVGDVNNDGFKDVGYGVHHNYSTTDFGDQVLEVVLGDGTGLNWTPYDDSLGLQGQTYGMFGTDFADIDNDGLLDIGSNSFGCCDGIHVSRNNGNGVWPQTFGFIGGNSGHWFEFGDIDNDGFMDFAAARQGGTVYFGDGTGQFTLKDIGLPASGIIGFDFVHLANVDNDPQLELGFCINGGIFIYKWNAATQQWQNISGNLPASGNNYVMRIADMNRDGIMDVAALSTGSLLVFTGNGNNTYTSAVTQIIPGFDFPRQMVVADLNHSGRPDILVFGRYPTGLFSSVNRLRIMRENSVAVTNAINAMTPDSGQCFPNNSIRYITWQSTLTPGTQGLVNLELIYSGGPGTWDTIAAGIPDNGSFQWTVPGNINSSYCIIRYTLTDTSGTVIYDSTLSEPFNIGCQSPTGLVAPTADWKLFPNPASDQITLYFDEILAQRTLCRITDLAGRVVKTVNLAPGTSHISLNINDLRSGLYFVHLGLSTNKSRLVINR